MESFNTTLNLNLTILALGMIVSTHAVAIEITQADCGTVFTDNDTIFELSEDVVCSTADNPNLALEFSGDRNQFFLQGFSITAASTLEPARGISITGDNNHIIGGDGTVEGFGTGFVTDGNIVIENASNNHVSGLHLNGGEHGVLMVANSATELTGNHIYHTIIDNANSSSIFLEARTGGNIQANHIYHNHIQGGTQGVFIRSGQNTSNNGNQVHDNSIQGITSVGISISGSGSADANQVYDNSIQDAQGGIFVSSGALGSADANQVHNNNIHDPEGEGIRVSVGSSSSANENIIFLNHIIRPEPGSAAIAFPSDSGSIANNVITYNFTEQPQATLVYCDSTGQVNHWQVNFIDLVPEIGTPGLCP